MSFIYDNLPEGNYIRLLEARVIKHSNRHELRANFKVVCLDDCNERYKALSYCWGDTVPAAGLRFSNSQSLPISQTLHDLFEALQSEGDYFTLWIDAICINQTNIHEKEHQVEMMGRVYSSAEQVLLWLGTSTPTTQAAFRFMDSHRERTWPDDWDDDTDISDIESMFLLLERPWFHRVWVIQEVTLNENVLMACGSDRMDFELFQNCIWALWSFYDGLNNFDDDHPAVTGLWSVTRLLDIRLWFQESGSVPYEILLEAAYKCEATDQRDKVFAFRGIADGSQPVPKPVYDPPVGDQPGYDASIDRVYAETAVALLCHGTSLDALALAGIHRNQSQHLPTWVLNPRQFLFDEPFAVCEGGGWDTGGPLLSPAKLVATGQVQLQVKRFDVVALTCPPFQEYSVAGQQKAVRAVLALRPRFTSLSDKKWLEMLGSCFLMGMDMEYQPIGMGILKDFYKWLEWVQTSTSQEDLEKIRKNRYHRTIGPRVDDWKVFMTEGGLICIGPEMVEVGDEVFVVPGCRFPLVLRAAAPTIINNNTLPQMLLLSWCFVDGETMYGAEGHTELPVVDIVLQ